MASNGDFEKESLLSPAALCHFVLKTTPDNYKPMVDFYQTFLGARITHANERITFMTYDHEHHRIAIIGAPGLERPTKRKNNIGLAHTAFGFDTLSDLATSYEQKKSHGILPVWCVNHGMSMSMVCEKLTIELQQVEGPSPFRVASDYVLTSCLLYLQYYEDPGEIMSFALCMYSNIRQLSDQYFNQMEPKLRHRSTTLIPTRKAWHLLKANHSQSIQ